jgi:hypothetical protein
MRDSDTKPLIHQKVPYSCVSNAFRAIWSGYLRENPLSGLFASTTELDNHLKVIGNVKLRRAKWVSGVSKYFTALGCYQGPIPQFFESEYGF